MIYLKEEGIIQRNEGIFPINLDRLERRFGAAVQNNAPVSPEEAELLRDVRVAREKLSDAEPLIASALSDLADALEKRDAPRIRLRAKELSTGVAADVMRETAGKALLKFLNRPAG